MKFKSPLLVVADMEASKRFYRQALGLRVVADYGANVTLTGGIALQTGESWLAFTGLAAEALRPGGNAAELYFEEPDLDAFCQRLQSWGVRLLHPVHEQPWGQRAVRFYDPDGHLLEVGEPMDAVVRRLRQAGLTARQTAEKTGLSLTMVERWSQ